MIRPTAIVRLHLSCLLVLAAMLSCTSISFAQIDPDPLLLGVHVDADGLLTARRSTDDPKLLATRKAALAKARKEARALGKPGLTYVSLPGLFAQAKAAVDEGKEIPQDVLLLSGMTKLRYVFLYPDEKDLVIAGDSEPYHIEDSARPIGLLTGRPVLRLDDLVTVLRTVGPGRARGQIACSIDPSADAMKVIADIIADPDNRKMTKEKKAELLASSIGPHTVRILGVQPDTRVAYVCVEADYILKRMAMGVDPTPVSAVQRVHQSEKVQFNGLWFTPMYDPLLVSADGRAYEIRGQSLQLHARGAQFENAAPTVGTAGYAKQFTKYFPQLAAAVPAFADLANITDLSLLAALIGQDKLHEKAGWNMDWILSEKGYPVPKVAVARTADSLATYRTGVYIVGGVDLSFKDAMGPKERNKDDEGKLKPLPARPQADWKLVK